MDSEDILVRFLFAQSLYAIGNVTECIEEYEGVLERHPMHCEARWVRAYSANETRLHGCETMEWSSCELLLSFFLIVVNIGVNAAIIAKSSWRLRNSSSFETLAVILTASCKQIQQVVKIWRAVSSLRCWMRRGCGFFLRAKFKLRFLKCCMHAAFIWEQTKTRAFFQGKAVENSSFWRAVWKFKYFDMRRESGSQSMSCIAIVIGTTGCERCDDFTGNLKSVDIPGAVSNHKLLRNRWGNGYFSSKVRVQMLHHSRWEYKCCNIPDWRTEIISKAVRMRRFLQYWWVCNRMKAMPDAGWQSILHVCRCSEIVTMICTESLTLSRVFRYNVIEAMYQSVRIKGRKQHQVDAMPCLQVN